MIKRPPKQRIRWRKIRRDERCRAEAYLRAREEFCVSASAHFLKLEKRKGHKRPGHIWRLTGPDGEISALLLHSRQFLFPVFDKNVRIPGPRFLNRFLCKVRIHALQGLRENAEQLGFLMEEQGYYATERIDYVLMGMDSGPRPEALKAGPAGLVLRSPLPEDEEDLFALQSVYEQEEVLPKNAAFYAPACRLNLQHILSYERVLVAELDGQVVGKINTSAESFTRYQVGGVYVRPDCRGRGIGTRMTAAFAGELLAGGRGITLFVKKRNSAAIKAYYKAGLTALAAYRITYYSS
jgi:ribosomal protein S18 acetylase RimI-like enzyme